MNTTAYHVNELVFSSCTISTPTLPNCLPTGIGVNGGITF